VAMHRRQFILFVDVLLLVITLTTFGTGIVLFSYFHIDDGVFRASAFSLSRLTWLNLHRLAALGATAALGLHLALNSRPFIARLRRGFSRKRRTGDSIEQVLYVSFATVAAAGIASLFFIHGSAQFAGPVQFGPLPQFRHHVIDIHNVAGFVSLSLAIHHVGHRWHRMIHGLSLFWRDFGRRKATRRGPHDPSNADALHLGAGIFPLLAAVACQPSIPHPIGSQSDQYCNRCHSGSGRTRASGHGDKKGCTSCHKAMSRGPHPAHNIEPSKA